MLDHPNFYATAGGHGGCRGCGEVTAIRLVMATSHALGDERRRDAPARARRARGPAAGQARRRSTRPTPSGARGSPRSSRRWRPRLYLYEGGPTGNGPASTVIANATGCSSVYASTMPFNAYLDPWVNSLFQDAQPLAKGIFEGISAQVVADVRALRIAQLELEDAYDPAVHDAGAHGCCRGRSSPPTELDLLPTVLTIGGDGASYDIGFGAMSRVLASDTPIKVLVLELRRLLQHRRPGLDVELHRPGLRPVPLRRRPPRQARGPQGARPAGVVPPPRVRLRHQHGDARALPAEHDADARVPRARGDGRLHAVRQRARHLGVVVQRAGAARGREPDAPAVRPRPAPRRDAARLVLARRQPRHRQDLDDRARWSTSTTTAQLQLHDDAADAGRVRPRRGAVQEAVPPAGRGPGGRRAPDRRVRRAAAARARGRGSRSSTRPTTTGA